MALPKTKPTFTFQQYLLLERSSEERHEYLDGVVFAMAGESVDHGRISVNLVKILGNQLDGRPCEVFSKDARVLSRADAPARATNRGLFSYPDVVVVCGDLQFFDEKRDVITNPKVIFEILSPTTESFDRVEKFDRYRTCNASLTDYLLVWQDQPQIERSSRQADGGWLIHRYTGLDAVVPLPSIDCRLSLKDVYARVVFRPGP